VNACSTPDGILIVDDMAACSFIIECLLEQAGISNHITFNGAREALAYLRTNGAIGLVITDYLMPEINGVELLNKCREFNERLKGIIVSCDPGLIPAAEHEYVVIEKGERLHQDLIGHVKKMIHPS
jgi:DNA-binding NtrC family response regulator